MANNINAFNESIDRGQSICRGAIIFPVRSFSGRNQLNLRPVNKSPLMRTLAHCQAFAPDSDIFIDNHRM